MTITLNYEIDEKEIAKVAFSQVDDCISDIIHEEFGTRMDIDMLTEKQLNDIDEKVTEEIIKLIKNKVDKLKQE